MRTASTLKAFERLLADSMQYASLLEIVIFKSPRGCVRVNRCPSVKRTNTKAEQTDLHYKNIALS